MNFTRIKKLEECVCQLRQGLENGDFGGGACMQFPYTYSPLDDQTPAAGFFQIDAGSIFINGIDGNAQDRTGTFDSLTTGFFIFAGSDGVYYYASISAQAENAGIYELTISEIDGIEPVADAEGCILIIPSVEAETPDIGEVLGSGQNANGSSIQNLASFSGPFGTGGGGEASVVFSAPIAGNGSGATVSTGGSNDGASGVVYSIAGAIEGSGGAGVTVLLGSAAVATNGTGGGYQIVLGVGDGVGDDGQFRVTNIPTADPSVGDAFWSDNGVIVQSGSTAPVGVTAFAYQFNTGTSGDPTSGKLLLNNATLASVTAIHIHETDFDGNVIGPFIATWDDSTNTVRGHLVIRSKTTKTDFAVYQITGALTDIGAYDTIVLTHVASGGTFSNNEPVIIEFVRSGNVGAAGAAGAAGDLASIGIISALNAGNYLL